MKLIGNLIDDEALEQVSGGGGFIPDNFADYDSECIFQKISGGPHKWVIMRDRA